MWRGLLVTVLLALAAPAAGAQEEEYASARFELFNDCRPMQLLVENVAGDAAAIGLTVSDLQVVAESRLRSARIYTEDAFAAGLSFLYVNYTVNGPAFGLDLYYVKRVEDDFGEPGSARTWTRGVVSATHGRGKHYVTAQLSTLMDQFLVAYLRANEEACEAR